LELGTPIQFTIALQGFNYSGIAGNASLRSNLVDAVADAVAEEANVSVQNVSVVLKQSSSPPKRMRRLQEGTEEGSDLLLDVSVFSSQEPSSSIADHLSPELAIKVASEIDHLEGIESVLDDNITISSMTAPAVKHLEVKRNSGKSSENRESSSAFDITWKNSIAPLIATALLLL